MLTHFLKFFHIIFAVSLLGSTLYCLALAVSRKLSMHHFSIAHPVDQLHRFILWLGFFALVTGTFLVYPAHFTFHTPWIQAAYLLIVLFGTGIVLLTKMKKNSVTTPWLWRSAYFVLVILLIAIIHDAVTKSTFLPF